MLVEKGKKEGKGRFARTFRDNNKGQVSAKQDKTVDGFTIYWNLLRRQGSHESRFLKHFNERDSLIFLESLMLDRK